MNKKSSTGYIGLVNIGDTQYLNSAIQSFFFTPEFRKIILDFKYDSTIHGKLERCLPFHLQSLFLELLTIRDRDVSAEKLTKSLGWDYEKFSNFDLNDFMEIFIDCLDYLDRDIHAPNFFRPSNHKEKNNRNEMNPLVEKNNEILITDLYRGKSVQRIYVKDRLDSDGKKIGKVREEEFSHLFMNVQGIDSLEKCIDNLMMKEIIEYMDYEKFGGEKLKAVSGWGFLKFPKILSIRFRRTAFNRITFRPHKSLHSVSFPIILDVSPYYYHKKEKKEFYELFAVFTYREGDEKQGSHKVLIKSFEDRKWYCFDDLNVTQITNEKVRSVFGEDEKDVSSDKSKSDVSYMLMYRRMDVLDQDEIERRKYSTSLSFGVSQIEVRIKGGEKIFKINKILM